jgi:hypothetical protein
LVEKIIGIGRENGFLLEVEGHVLHDKPGFSNTVPVIFDDGVGGGTTFRAAPLPFRAVPWNGKERSPHLLKSTVTILDSLVTVCVNDISGLEESRGVFRVMSRFVHRRAWGAAWV